MLTLVGKDGGSASFLALISPHLLICRTLLLLYAKMALHRAASKLAPGNSNGHLPAHKLVRDKCLRLWGTTSVASTPLQVTAPGTSTVFLSVQLCLGVSGSTFQTCKDLFPLDVFASGSENGIALCKLSKFCPFLTPSTSAPLLSNLHSTLL